LSGEAGNSINLDTADGNILIGQDAGVGGAAAMIDCVVIGKQALDATAANAQTGTIAIGSTALSALTSGARNLAIGYQALEDMTVGNDNIAIGYLALNGLTTDANANQNIAIGNYVMDVASNSASTAQNVCIGHNSGTLLTGDDNTCVGNGSGATISSGQNNTIIGSGADCVATHNNTTAIGYGATSQAHNTVTLGDGNVTAVYMAEDSGATVHCAAVTEGSSLEIKKNISEIESPLDKITKLRGIEFDYKETDEHSIGMIAEEVNEVFPELVTKNKDGEVEAMSYSRMTAVLLEAVKELSQEVKELKMSNNYNSKEGD
jgi:hypothetical protein